MLFSSYAFIFIFLPVALAAYYVPSTTGRRKTALTALTIASLVFYAWDSVENLALLLMSISFNFFAAILLQAPSRPRIARLTLLLSLAANISIIVYFKYLGFGKTIINAVLGTDFAAVTPVLPIGISFYTFVQIAYLVDVYKGVPRETNFVRYALFVTFFPHLIAGPIIHHTDLLPQFARQFRPKAANALALAGITVFSIGLFKKVVLADSIAPLANLVFDAAASGKSPSLIDAWAGAFAYTLQLYFDFSGYSDMAIGLSAMFGIRLPLNFFSPYKAQNISEFWRRWHMTLSRFLRQYIYIPLGGNRRGPARRYVNLMATMVIGGLWHGAGWTFLAWGFLHGLLLALHQVYRSSISRKTGRIAAVLQVPSIVLTLFCVVLGWVLFRATSMQAALTMYGAMFGLVSPSSGANYLLEFASSSNLASMFQAIGIQTERHATAFGLTVFAVLFGIVILLPNTSQYMATRDPASSDSEIERKAYNLRWLRWKASGWTGLLFAGMTIISLLFLWPINSNPPFLYFNF